MEFPKIDDDNRSNESYGTYLMKKYFPLVCTVLIYVLGGCYLLFYNSLSFHIPCLFRLITGIPCPGCGMTRAFRYIIDGKLLMAINTNFFAIPLFAFLAIVPIWIAFDILNNRQTFESAMRHTWTREHTIIALLIIAIGWIYNIIANYRHNF